jgi:hydroxyethylthiazole kinase
MIISPPYLLPRNAGETDDAWIRRCMPATGPGDGAYPLGHALQWHGGVHLIEPEANAPVRAIADGTVVFKRDPTPQPQGGLPPDHPQGYFGGWTDNGVVVIQHTTEIGEGPNASVTFFSIYMHLREIDSKIKLNETVYRKAPLGRAGSVFGETGRFHFEIVCDDVNLRRLVGRASGNLNTGANGRTDAVYGSMYFRLPADTQVYPDRPALNLAQGTGGTPIGVEVFVELRYAHGEGAAGNRGDAYLSTYQADGTRIGEPLEENDAEYNLYRDANTISQAYPANARPAPSAVYELLRFGRVIGPDALNPANVPHWRRIQHPGGTGWVNLNANNINKFSDADFPQWIGWSLVDDSTDQDSRCDSAMVKGWLDVNGDGRVTPEEALARMSSATVAPKLAKAICKFPTEWNAESFDRRLGWITSSTAENPNPVDAANFERLRAHVAALAFWPGNTGLPESHWHWNPGAFIRQFRRCGWLSEREMTQCIPRTSPAGTIPLDTATTRVRAWKDSINKMARKFSLSTTTRLTHLLAQIWAETGYLRLTREVGADEARYAPYIGRGLIQITWQDKYDAYRAYCLLPTTFNIELIATDQHHAGNSSGFYWVSKTFYEPSGTQTSNLSRLTDLGITTDAIGKLCLWINGGGNHYDHRHIHTLFITRVLGDGTSENRPQPETLTFSRMEFLRETITRNGRASRVIRGTQRAAANITITINHTPQR